MDWNNVLLLVGSLLGFAAFVSLLVNVLKFFGIVQDGTSQNWVAGLNLAGALILYVILQLNPNFDVIPIDNILGEVALIGSAVVSYIVMIFGSRVTYAVTKGVGLIGKTFD